MDILLLCLLVPTVIWCIGLQFQISSIGERIRQIEIWKTRGFNSYWIDKNMDGHYVSLSFDESLYLILQHLKLQIRKEDKRAKVVIEKIPKPTKEQEEAIKQRDKAISSMFYIIPQGDYFK